MKRRPLYIGAGSFGIPRYARATHHCWRRCIRKNQSTLLLYLGAALRVAGDASPSQAAAAEAALVSQLRDAPLATDRVNILSSDSEFEFDFIHPPTPPTTGKGGSLVLANAGNFPAVIGTSSAMAVGFLDACSMNTPHMHPRATEMQYSVNGTIRTGMITENGARFITTELPPGSMTLFPVGSIHFQINDGCDPITFVSTFNSEDPGALQVAQRFLGLPPDIVATTLGAIGVEDVVGLEAIIPDNIALGTDKCLKRCGITRTEQPTAQRQDRVEGNALPSLSSYASAAAGSETTTSWKGAASKSFGYKITKSQGASAQSKWQPMSASAAYSTYTSAGVVYTYATYPNSNSGPLAADLATDNNNNGSSSDKAILIALIALNGALALGLIVVGVLFYRSRRAGHRARYTSVGASGSGDPIFAAPLKVTQYEAEKGYAEGDETPLTHGLSHGPYYDPHDPASVGSR